MRLNKITFEIVLFVLAGLAALAIRFLFLGSIPLNDNEANLALQALALSKGESVILSGHPAYLVLTSFFMSMFGATEFTARVWPALAGVVMVGAAWFLRDALGRNNALVLAFALALDPILVASSRNAGSAALAIVFVAGGFVFALLSRSLVTGIFLGLALLSGPQIWPGAVGLFLMGLVLRKSMGEDEARPQINWRTLLIAAGMTLALGSTFFFLYPGGFTGIGGGLADYLSGWGKPSGVPPTRLLAVLIYYELPLVVLAIINLIRGLRAGDRMAQAMGVWWAAALLLALIYPGRDVYSLVWSALPMLLLAVRQIVDLKFSSKDGQLVVIGQAALTIVLLFFMVYRLINLPLGVEGTPVPADILLSIGIGMVLLVAVTVAIGYGWTWAGAARGLILGSLFWAGVLWIS
ncbi:MAG: glycosyltransferase family 39 protein, partial [Anaerolineae bacterium]|nr:glycosyltransferase family 39 protein [Anaerolineae bacterium]